MFLKNCWYVAAWASEVGEGPFARTICDLPIVIFRTGGGKFVALEDRCCHRNLPLSMGRIEGEALRCGYHGLKFDGSGRCIEIPGQKQIPPAARVQSFPLVERWGMLWLWPGRAPADENLLPNWDGLDDPRLVRSNGNGEKPLSMRCNWQLNNDNLLDLSHVFYVHKSTLGAPGMENLPIKSSRSNRGVSMSRWMPGTAPIPLFTQYLGLKDGQMMDRWQGTDAELPTHCLIHAGFAPAGALAPDDMAGRDKYIRFHAFITATPETAGSSFMFYVQARNFAHDNTELTHRIVNDFRTVFGEDIAVMEGQQRVNERYPEAPTVDVSWDGPPLAMRRLLAERMAAESAAEKTAGP
jgi:phenylpropionate dioxygenase-like ring-hydroxylating dioxygenase large terminal subunit